MMKDVQENMKPVVDMAEINKKAAEKLIELQSGYVSDFVNATMAQMQALSSIKDPKEAIDLQVEYVKTLEAKLSNVAEEEMAALNDAKTELTAIIEKSFSGLGLKDMNYFEDLSKFMTSAAPAAKAETKPKPAAAPKAAAKPAPAKLLLLKRQHLKLSLNQPLLKRLHLKRLPSRLQPKRQRQKQPLRRQLRLRKPQHLKPLRQPLQQQRLMKQNKL